jgi:hypothetical protein
VIIKINAPEGGLPASQPPPVVVEPPPTPVVVKEVENEKIVEVEIPGKCEVIE